MRRRVAARRGVRVQLMLPGLLDVRPLFLIAARSFYEKLLTAGVEIYERQGVVLHAKTMVIDGRIAVIGSTNLDYRSIEYNCELSTVLRNDEFGAQMCELFENDIRYARRIRLSEWRRRPFLDRFGQWCVTSRAISFVKRVCPLARAARARNHGLVAREVYVKAFPLAGFPHMLITKLWQNFLGTNDLLLDKLPAAHDSVIDVASSAFADNNPIPAKYSADGDNVSFPVAWSNRPDGTKSWTVMIDDPDAPFPKPFVHWLIFNIPSQLRALPEAVPNDSVVMSLQGVAQGKNSKLGNRIYRPQTPQRRWR